jgi:hypothetical protein
MKPNKERKKFFVVIYPRIGPSAPSRGRHADVVACQDRASSRARATDASGNCQPDSPAWNRLGYGNNAVQVLLFDVR